jgi:hypothetical protein
MVLRPRSVLWETHRSLEDSESFLGFATEGYRRGDFGGWGIVLRDNGAFVGRPCGLDAGYAPSSVPAPSLAAVCKKYASSGWQRAAGRQIRLG